MLTISKGLLISAAALLVSVAPASSAPPDHTVSCAVGPEPFYTTLTVCNAVIGLLTQYSNDLVPGAGYQLLESYGNGNSKTVLAIVEEMKAIGASTRRKSKMMLIEQCASDLQKRFPGNERPQYLNACQELVGYFK